MDGVSTPPPLEMALMSICSSTNHDFSNVFTAIRFLGIIRFAESYAVVGLIFKILQKTMPSLANKRAAHLDYTKKMIDARLARETDRSDFMTYVRTFGSLILVI